MRATQLESAPERSKNSTICENEVRPVKNDIQPATQGAGWASDGCVALTFRSATPHADLKVGATSPRDAKTKRLGFGA